MLFCCISSKIKMLEFFQTLWLCRLVPNHFLKTKIGTGTVRFSTFCKVCYILVISHFGIYTYIGGGGGGHESFWQFSRGILKNTH